MCIATLNYQKLDNHALDTLQSAKLSNDKESIEKIKALLGFRVDQLCVIDKCNAVMVVFTYYEDLLPDFVRGRTLATWDSLAPLGITACIRDIKFLYDEDAVRYIGECAVGIHSVVPGDSQVFSQVVDSLQQASFDEGPGKGTFSLLIGWLKEIIIEVKNKSNLLSGNTSLERIACEFLMDKMSDQRTISILGYGKTGRLVTKILSGDNDVEVKVANRTKIELPEGSKKDKIHILDLKDIENISDSQYIINTLSNNSETEKYVALLVKNSNTIQDATIIDLASPSLFLEKVPTVFDIEYFSNIAHRNIQIRSSEIQKVKEIVGRKLPVFMEAVGNEYGKSFLRSQQSLKMNKIDAEKLKMVIARNELYKSVRNYLESETFTEITTPYIVGVSTDPPKVDKGGAIRVDWQLGASAFLRQSNQIYKQILVASGMDKVYEIGPFWRAETFESYRHLQESIGLDVEMKNPRGLEELYLLACSIISHSNTDVQKKCGIKNNLQFPAPGDIPVLTYETAVHTLNESGNPVTFGEDLGLVSEAKLGQIIKKKFNSDIFVIRDYPDTIKKFYTKKKEPGLTETFDVIVCGWELVSGAIRQTNGEQIRKSMAISGIDPETYSFYISIVDGAVSHGGFCIGIDRLLAKILELEMVSDAVVFPRTFKKLIP